jgi:hypothetical protein
MPSVSAASTQPLPSLPHTHTLANTPQSPQAPPLERTSTVRVMAPHSRPPPSRLVTPTVERTAHTQALSNAQTRRDLAGIITEDNDEDFNDSSSTQEYLIRIGTLLEAGNNQLSETIEKFHCAAVDIATEKHKYVTFYIFQYCSVVNLFMKV